MIGVRCCKRKEEVKLGRERRSGIAESESTPPHLKRAQGAETEAILEAYNQPIRILVINTRRYSFITGS